MPCLDKSLRLVFHRICCHLSPWPTAHLLPRQLSTACIRATPRSRCAPAPGSTDHVGVRPTRSSTKPLSGLRTRSGLGLSRQGPCDAPCRHRRDRRAPTDVVWTPRPTCESIVSSLGDGFLPDMRARRAFAALRTSRAHVRRSRIGSVSPRSRRGRDQPTRWPSRAIRRPDSRRTPCSCLTAPSTGSSDGVNGGRVVALRRTICPCPRAARQADPARAHQRCCAVFHRSRRRCGNPVRPTRAHPTRRFPTRPYRP